jgi:uncharacterized protein YndB with AHSA1/START domain
MNEASKKATPDRERPTVQISREFDAPRASVFQMFTDAKKAAKFWGPEGAVNEAFEIEPRAGGAIRIVDRMDNLVGTTSGTVEQIVAPELLVFRSATSTGPGKAPWEVLQSMAFEEIGPKRTRVTVRVKVLKTGSWDGDSTSLGAGYQGGWGETFDRLQRELR